MSNETLRQLGIKLASVKRIRKELAFYEADAVKEQSRFDKLRSSQIDPHDLQQAENVLSEAKAMVPDSKQRLEWAIRDLKQFLSQEDEELGDSLSVQEARELLTEVQPLIV